MTLVHPDLLTSLERSGFFPSSVTLRSRAAGVDAYGQPNGAYADVAGLIALSCSVNRVYGSRAAQERMRGDATLLDVSHVIALAGSYPAATTAMQALVDDVDTYNVLSVEHDAQSASTYLLVKRVST